MKTRQKRSAESLVVGLDCSTTATKAIAFDRHGSVEAFAHESIPLSSPQPGYYEQEPDDWWTAARKTLRTLGHQIDPARIVALAIANQRETFVPLDRGGNRLRPAIIWLDERSKDYVKPFSESIGAQKIHRITGKPPDYAPVVYRLAWMKDREPSLYRRIGAVCDVHAYLAWKLTGTLRTCWASADPLGLFDLKRKRWSPEILEALQLKVEQLPEVFPPGTVLGRLTPSVAGATGLSADTMVLAGGGDGQCAGLGANVLTSARAYLNLGTAVVTGVYGERYLTRKAFRTMASCSEQGYYYECSLRAGTFAIDWFVGSVLGIDRKRQPGVYAQLEEEALQVPAGSEGVLHLPYLCGAMNPHWDMNARGAFVGLSSSHRRGHIYRAILEGIAFEQVLAVSAVERETGVVVKELVAIGGGSASGLWRNIIADVSGKNLCLPANREASALGAAIAAAVGVGWYRTFAGAAKAMTHIRDRITPNPGSHQTYRAVYQQYRRMYAAVSKIKNPIHGVSET